uniref:Uncharacterized protein n=1 Tax=Zea mays TaxID=4577 RepID=B4FMV9_MAIZE|nr:unknown [Zea mays]
MPKGMMLVFAKNLPSTTGPFALENGLRNGTSRGSMGRFQDLSECTARDLQLDQSTSWPGSPTVPFCIPTSRIVNAFCPLLFNQSPQNC